MSGLINREDAIKSMANAIWHYPNELYPTLSHYQNAKDLAEYGLKDVPSIKTQPITCDGCKHVGTYDTDFPCSSCIRREKDYYEPEE